MTHLRRRGLSWPLFLLLSLLLVAVQRARFAEGGVITIQSNTFDGTPIWGDWDYGAGDIVFLLTNRGTLYRSVQGSALTAINGSFPQWSLSQAPFYRTGLRGVIATSNPNKLYAVGYSNQWVTYDAGATWITRTYSPDIIYSSLDPDPSNSDVATMSSWSIDCYSTNQTLCHRRIFVTTDFGATWTERASYVSRIMWASDVSSVTPRLYAMVYPEGSGNQLTLPTTLCQLVVTDNFFQTTRVLATNTSSFVVRGPFVDAGFIRNGVTELWTSGNYGKTFTAFAIPSWSYGILLSPEVSSQHLFIMPANQAVRTRGQAYHSDISGARFVLEAPAMAINPTSGVDFHYDPKIPGVLFANMASLDLSGAETRVTMISRNNGGSWAPIQAPSVDSHGNPTNCQTAAGCYLQLFLTKNADGSFITHTSIPGMIITRGMLGTSLSNDASNYNLYISNDAGWTWRELIQGPYSAAISDYGALILVASPPPVTFFYSFDQGASFNQLPVSPAPTGSLLWLDSTPSNNSMAFVALTASAGYIIKFPADSQRICRSTDFYTWSPKDPSGRSCLLGENWVVTSRYPSSACIPNSLTPISFSSRCSCINVDYECNFGYVAAGSACIISPTGPSPPPAANTRIISGDICQPTSSPIPLQ